MLMGAGHMSDLLVRCPKLHNHVAVMSSRDVMTRVSRDVCDNLFLFSTETPSVVSVW